MESPRLRARVPHSLRFHNRNYPHIFYIVQREFPVPLMEYSLNSKPF